MKAESSFTVKATVKGLLGLALGICGLSVGALQTHAQAPGPLTPPPANEHDVHRVTTTAPAAAPPSLAPAELIKAFAEKEDLYLRTRTRYAYKKTIKLTEFGKDGQPSGEYQIVVGTVVDPDGTVYERTLQKTQSSLQFIDLQPGGSLNAATRLPSYPLTTSQLAKYELRYVGDEKVDEIDCYIFDAKPKFLDRAHALFQGVVWVDKQYLEIVKTYGKWVNDLGDVHAQDLPFVNFETYRENVEGKYWFPNYARSDDFVRLKDMTVPVRLVIKWSDMKPLPENAKVVTEPSKP